MASTMEMETRTKIASKICQGLSSNKFSRELPTNENELLRRLDSDVPAHLLGLWGGSKEGNRNRANKSDAESLDFVYSVRGRLAEYSRMKASASLLFCDIHHKLANGRQDKEIRAYFESLKPLVEERGFELIGLQSVVGKAPVLRNYIDDHSLLAAQKILSDQRVLEKTIKSAKRHSQQIGSGTAPGKVVEIYVAIEVYFLHEVDRIFHHLPIFFSFSDPEVQKPIATASEIPMFHFHSNSRRRHECPWYS